ncbi:serine/arginine repetitive matrix protein 1-like [Sinocyclocheilus rhinocerous]|uniref:serine/arginine repetitive matrix protein 1-like n=1 Tax=Sinocyclocheilus rhinocerous TaxID=307959 RepID=UPI0007BA7350|nr:PREDICTED: serine/arginine repetitive matrix protein 1-like [Sinocyclocheilus rhinocerous]
MQGYWLTVETRLDLWFGAGDLRLLALLELNTLFINQVVMGGTISPNEHGLEKGDQGGAGEEMLSSQVPFPPMSTGSRKDAREELERRRYPLRFTVQVKIGARSFLPMSSSSKREAREAAVQAAMAVLIGEEEKERASTSQPSSSSSTPSTNLPPPPRTTSSTPSTNLPPPPRTTSSTPSTNLPPPPPAAPPAPTCHRRHVPLAAPPAPTCHRHHVPPAPPPAQTCHRRHVTRRSRSNVPPPLINVCLLNLFFFGTLFL